MADLAILAQAESWYYRDLARAAGDAGLTCERLEFSQLMARVGPAEDLGVLAGARGVLVRTMPPGSLEQVVWRMDCLQRLEANGVRVVNSARAMECAVDKYLTSARLAAAGLPTPATVVCETAEHAMAAFAELGGDVVVKPLFGSEGRGIVRVTDVDLAYRTFRTLERLQAVLYLQRFVRHPGYDLRVMVLGGRVLGGMKRSSADDFRTNVSRQGVASPHSPSEAEAELALQAIAVTGATIAGIDLLPDAEGALSVIEVNAVPGWQAFGRVSGLDVARLLIDEVLGD